MQREGVLFPYPLVLFPSKVARPRPTDLRSRYRFEADGSRDVSPTMDNSALREAAMSAPELYKGVQEKVGDGWGEGGGRREFGRTPHWYKAASEAVARTRDLCAFVDAPACIAQDDWDELLIIRPDSSVMCSLYE